jgi:hypothetical protein
MYDFGWRCDMATEIVSKDDLIRSLDGLSAESLAEASRFIEFVRFEAQRHPCKLVKLGGLWKNWPAITDEEIAQARQAMWGKVGECEP